MINKVRYIASIKKHNCAVIEPVWFDDIGQAGFHLNKE